LKAAAEVPSRLITPECPLKKLPEGYVLDHLPGSRQLADERTRQRARVEFAHAAERSSRQFFEKPVVLLKELAEQRVE
jgi:hypothetical protein